MLLTGTSVEKVGNRFRLYLHKTSLPFKRPAVCKILEKFPKKDFADRVEAVLQGWCAFPILVQ